MMGLLAAILGGLLFGASLLLFLAAAYLALLSTAAFLNPRKRERVGVFDRPRESPARFVVLVPAHNEEQLIAETVAGLGKLAYPREQFEVVVIADNCSDETAQRCRGLECTVLERTAPEDPGKGQALDWAMKRLLANWPRPFDAVLMVDADSVLNADFLWFMSERIRLGDELLQGYYTVRNPRDSWRTSLLAASLALFHFLRPLGRDRLGLPCGLKGNGFAMSRRLVREIGYPAGSNVEDLELSLILVARGVGAQFVPGAQVFGEMTTRADAAEQQRARWEGGRVALLKTWTGPLFRRALRTRNAACADALADLLMPPFALLVAAVLSVLVLSCAGGVLAPHAWLGAACWLSGASVALCAYYVLSGMLLARPPPIVWRRLLFAPGYVVWKLGLYIRILRDPSATGRWERTPRNREDDALEKPVEHE